LTVHNKKMLGVGERTRNEATQRMRRYWERRMKAIKILGGIAMAALLFSGNALAEWAPTQRVVLVSQSSPGTGNDVMLRALADIWTKNKMVPQLVSVENVTGALGENARRYVSKSNADNPHMLYAYTPGTLNQAILSKSEYTYDKFTPIGSMASDAILVVVNAGSSFKVFKDLVETAKTKPVLQGGGPYGASPSLIGRLLADHYGVELPYTPFKGGGEAVTALLGNHVQFLIENPSEVAQYITAGRMRAVAASHKLAAFPDVPTFSELGFNDRLPEAFRHLVAPPGIKAEVAEYYVNLLKKTVATPEWKKFVAQNALIEDGVTGPEAGAYLAEQHKIYRSLDEKMGLLK
jgi:putative tricarboxylic transport membrane protein